MELNEELLEADSQGIEDLGKDIRLGFFPKNDSLLKEKEI